MQICSVIKKNITMSKKQANNDFMTILPKGAIIMWSGNLSKLTKLSNWRLCDGKHDTPDLTNRFIVGAGGDYLCGDVGGTNQVTLTIDQIPSHSHNINSGKTTSGTGQSSYCDIYKANESGNQDGTLNVGGDQPHENRPPYFALYYIMKIKSDNDGK